MKNWLLFLCSFWMVLWSNARMLDFLEAFPSLWIARFPSAMKGFEVLSLLALFGLVLTSRRRYYPRVLPLVLTFLAVAIVGILLSSRFNIFAMQGIYIYVAPFVVFVTALALRVNKADIEFLFLFFGAVLVISILVACYQLVTYTNSPLQVGPGDHINSFFKDAHIFGFFLLIFSTISFQYFLHERNTKALLISVSLFMFSFFPSNEKMILYTLFFNFVFTIELFRGKNLGKKIAIMTAVILGVFAGTGLLMYMISKQYTMLRLDWVFDLGIENIGPVKAWGVASSAIMVSPLQVLFGLGSAHFGGEAVRGALVAGVASPLSQQFYDMMVSGEGVIGGFVHTTNTWSALLAEFGVLGFLLFGRMVYLIARPIIRMQTLTTKSKVAKRTFLYLLGGVVFAGLFNPYSNWGEGIWTFPMMLIGAYVLQDQPQFNPPVASKRS